MRVTKSIYYMPEIIILRKHSQRNLGVLRGVFFFLGGGGGRKAWKALALGIRRHRLTFQLAFQPEVTKTRKELMVAHKVGKKTRKRQRKLQNSLKVLNVSCCADMLPLF